MENWNEELKNRKDGKIPYLQYKTVICKERTQIFLIRYSLCFYAILLFTLTFSDGFSNKY